MHADDVHLGTRIEHEILRLRAVYDSAIESHADAIGRIREYAQIVSSKIECKVDTARRQRTLSFAIGIAAARVPELVDERRERRCGSIAEHLHDRLHRVVEAA